jgi:hypothetical protein
VICAFTPSYVKDEKVMNENLIFEGNTVYEIDPLCVKEKEKQERKRRAMGETGKYGRTMGSACFAEESSCRKSVLLFGLLLLKRYC